MMYDVDAVLISVGITTGIVLALTIFAFQVQSIIPMYKEMYQMFDVSDQMGLHNHGRHPGVPPNGPHDLRHRDDLHSVLQVHADGVRRGGGPHLLLLPGL